MKLDEITFRDSRGSRPFDPATVCPTPRERGHGTGCLCGLGGRLRATGTQVLTIGTFDLLHFGHVDFLRAAATLGAQLTVGVNSDDFAASFKRRPVMTQDERIHALGQLGYPVLLNTSAGRELIEAHEPGVLAVGSDWARKPYLEQIAVTQDWLDGRQITLAYVPYVQHAQISTSEIIRRIRERSG